MPTLHIVTGPPGSGKTTWAEQNHPNLPVYDHDLGTLRDWERLPPHDGILTVTAPSHSKKDYWLARAYSYGYVTRLYCIDMSRMEAHQRAEERPVRNNKRTFKWIEYWYRNYTRHPNEEKIRNERTYQTIDSAEGAVHDEGGVRSDSGGAGT